MTQRQARILLVDDDPQICNSTAAVLRAAGFETSTAGGGAEAISRLAEKRFALALVDLNMPDVDGLSLIEHIQTQRLETGVIVVSGEADLKKALQVVKAGARDFVRKPHTPDELILAINKVLETINLENENRQIFEELKRSEELHRFIVQNSPDLMFMLDRRGELTFTNNMRELLGYSAEDVLGKHYSRFIHPGDLARAKRYFGRGHGDSPANRIELRLLSKNRRQSRTVEITTIKMSRNCSGYLLNNKQRAQPRRFIGFYGVARDITDRKRSEEIIRYQHNHDILTGLPNRGLLHERLTMLLAQAQQEETKVAALYIDLDRFKLINDSYGQMVGDELLQAVAETLKRCIRKEDTLARIGGDEFVLLLPQVNSTADATCVAKKIIEELAQPYHLNGTAIHITASIGVALFPDHAKDRESLIRNADIAVCNTKNAASSGLCVYSAELACQSSNKVLTENLLRSAIREDRLQVHYQPQINLQTGELHAAEALVRILTPDGRLLVPGHFIKIAEEANLINDLGKNVLEQVCRDVQQWQSEGLQVPVSINISAKQLLLEDFSDLLLERIDHFRLAPETFELELTENVIIQNLERTMQNLNRLTSSGIKIAIDDFGKGYSSLSYLDQLPLHTLKLDKSFVQNISPQREENTIIPAILSVSEGLKLKFVAEGVETRQQHEYLKSQGGCIAQGFYYSRPVDKQSFVKFVRDYDFKNFS